MRELRALVERQSETLAGLQQELADNKFQLGQQLRELNLVKVREQASLGSGESEVGAAVGVCHSRVNCVPVCCCGVCYMYVVTM